MSQLDMIKSRKINQIQNQVYSIENGKLLLQDIFHKFNEDVLAELLHEGSGRVIEYLLVLPEILDGNLLQVLRVVSLWRILNYIREEMLIFLPASNIWTLTKLSANHPSP